MSPDPDELFRRVDARVLELALDGVPSHRIQIAPADMRWFTLVGCDDLAAELQNLDDAIAQAAEARRQAVERTWCETAERYLAGLNAS